MLTFQYLFSNNWQHSDIVGINIFIFGTINILIKIIDYKYLFDLYFWLKSCHF